MRSLFNVWRNFIIGHSMLSHVYATIPILPLHANHLKIFKFTAAAVISRIPPTSYALMYLTLNYSNYVSRCLKNIQFRTKLHLNHSPNMTFPTWTRPTNVQFRQHSGRDVWKASVLPLHSAAS
jgi:hypothetical protein